MCRFGFKYFEMVLNVIVLLEIFWFFNEFGGNEFGGNFLVSVWSFIV